MLFRCSKLQLAVTLYLVAMMADPSFATKATNSNMQVEENWWKMFDQFHKDRQSEFARDQEKQDRKIEQDAAAAKKALESEKIDSTQASMTAQESVLLSPASAAKKQDARIYYIRDALELAFLLRFTDQSQRQKILTKVEQLIADARKNPLSSIQYGEIGFLEAGYYESIKQRDRVIATLNTLCKSATQTSEAVVAACVKSGDFVFQAESYEKAQKFYDTAEKAAKIVKLPAHSPLLADIQYRLAWTNYRSGNIEVVVKNSQQFLSGDIRRRYDDDTRRMKLDIAELLGNSLFEINDYDLIKKTLISLKAMKFADHAATMIVERFHDAKLYDQQLAFTDFLLQHFGTAAEMPTWLILGAKAAEEVKATEKKMLLYSQLGVLLPSGSLWRLRNNDALDQIGILDNEGPALVGAAAQYFYDIGSSSNSVVNFSESASLYRHLYEHDKSNALATTWLMREANCYFFSDNLITASKSFEDLRNNKQLSQEQLLVVNYQLAKIYEKQLRTEETGIQSKAGQTKLHILRETIEDFANKFPNDRRSSELLLVLANFYRDSNELVTAKKYWQRVLVEKSEPIHRGLAIRGIVFATMHVDPPSTLVAVAQNFLTSENFSEIGREIRNELLGVLSAAMLKESQALRTAGKTKESGELLRTITQQFGDLPQSDLFLRDAAYMLAVSGDWTNALETANSYLSSSRRKFTGDMLYLRARANEYQMEFLSAAKSYIDLFDQAPQHAKAKMSLERAYSLATAEDDHRLAAEAAMRLAKAATAIAMKSQFLENAFHEAVIAENYRLAAEAAHELEQQKSSLSAPIRARLFFAALAKQEGQVQKSVGILKQLVKEVAPLRSKIASQEYQALSGELHFLLGKDAFDQFDGYILAERSGSALVRLQQKTAYFDEAAREFSNVIQNGSPKWSAAARYHYALAAEKFSDEMSTFIERNRRELGASYTGYNDSASRLRKMSTRFHADNLFAGRRDVKTLANDEWVRLSKLRLSKLGSLPAETDQSADASVTPMPSQWR